MSTPTRLLYSESGILPLSKRRKFHRLVQMYKIVHQLAPDYLYSLLPQTVAERNPYAVRNPNLFSNYNCHTESLRNSFFPKTTSEWNGLPENIKTAESITSFKFLLKKEDDFHIPAPPKWYSYPRKLNIILAQLRNFCSPLHHDLANNHILLDPTCKQCGTNRPEDAKHYFLECNKYENIRQNLVHSFQNTGLTCNISNITKGSITLNFEENKILLDSVYSYIRDSKRFVSIT